MEYKTKKISTRYGVFEIECESDKKMAEALEKDAYPIEHLLEITRRFVDKKSTVVDIGAHIGTFAIPIAKEVGEVVAFEPSARAFELLVRNAEENKVQLRARCAALGSSKGSGTLLVRNASNAGANTLLAGDGDIPVTTLDSEVAHADFIKMDVEGMELEVLKGGRELIERSRPVVVFEVNLSQLRAHGTSPRALERFFTERGYRLYVPLERGSLVLARVGSATLLTALIAPRAWLFSGESAPFDLVAVPQERPLTSIGFIFALRQAVGHNLAIKRARIRAFLRRIF